MTLREGQHVSFVGQPLHGLTVADEGRALSVSGTACHVLWSTGRLAGRVTLEDAEDLVATGSRVAAPTEDSLDDGTLVSLAVRDTYDSAGDVGVLNALSDAGHLASMANYAEEAFTLVAARVREDPSFRAVLSQLEPEEGDGLVQLTSAVLLRDAFSGVPDD